jgi:hypothetical protein
MLCPFIDLIKKIEVTGDVGDACAYMENNEICENPDIVMAIEPPKNYNIDAWCRNVIDEYAKFLDVFVGIDSIITKLKDESKHLMYLQDMAMFKHHMWGAKKPDNKIIYCETCKKEITSKEAIESHSDHFVKYTEKQTLA